ncbi:MAG: periplasmic heavy metal sensor [Gemmatimonadota bacterium]|nr:periplasmic heavy metal sensor [Gemmatimonadota bacterium]
MKRQFIIWGVVLLTVVNVASLSTLGYHRWFGDHRERAQRVSWEERRRAFEKALGLTAVQIEKRDAMRKALGEELKPLREALKEKRDVFFNTLIAADSDRALIDSLNIEVDMLEQKIEGRFIDYAMAQKGILTPEQFEKVFSSMRRRYGNGNGYRGSN